MPRLLRRDAGPRFFPDSVWYLASKGSQLFSGRKFVPNDTYEDHKVTCIQVASSPTQRSDLNESGFSDQFSGGDFSDGHRDPMEDDIGPPQHGEMSGRLFVERIGVH